MFIKTFKKAISLLVIAMFILSLVPVGALADTTQETAQVYFTNYSYTRHSGKSYLNDPGTFVNKSDLVHEIHFGGQYYGYVQLDLTGYEEILANEGTTIKVTIVGGPYTSTQRSCGDFKAYLVNDVADGSYKSKVTTKKQADDLNMHDTTRPVLFAKSDGVTLKSSQNGGQPGTYDADVDALVSCLNEGSDNSLVTLYLVPTGTVSPSYINPKISYLEIFYDANEVDNQSYVDDITSDITWDKITDDDINNITKDLPTFYKGATISWEASVPGIVSSNGEITPPLGESSDVTLTATFTYKDATTTTTFDATVAPEQAIEVRIPFSNYAYSRDSASSPADPKNHTYQYATYSGFDCIQAGGSFDGYAQLDLKGYEEIINNPSTTAIVRLEAGYQYGTARLNPVAGRIAPDSADGYSWKTITWNIAEKQGIHSNSNPVLFTTSDADVTPGNTSEGAANMQNLATAINESSDSVISLHFSPVSGDSKIRISSENSGLFITYYESQIDDAAFFADIESSFAWDTITSDAQEAVVNDLPTYYKGADIVWSSGEGAVTSAGELIPADGALVKDTITANVSYKDYSFTKEFVVTICDGKTALGTPALTVEGGKATASLSAVNGTGNDVVYKLYLATYTGDELIELVPFDFAVGKGKSEDKTMDVSCPDGYKAKFFVWKSDGITPVLDATVK